MERNSTFTKILAVILVLYTVVVSSFILWVQRTAFSTKGGISPSELLQGWIPGGLFTLLVIWGILFLIVVWGWSEARKNDWVEACFQKGISVMGTRTFSLLYTAISTVLIAGLIFALYSIFSGFSGKSTSTPVTPSQQTPSVRKTSDWQTFSASKWAEEYGDAYDFEIEYPPMWTLREHDSGTGVSIFFYSPDYKVPETGIVEKVLDGARIELFIAPKQKFSSLQEWHAEYFASYLENGSAYDSGVQVGSARDTIIAGKEGIEFEVSGLGGDAMAKAVNVGDIVYTFRVVYKSGQISFVDVLNQMLSTFKTVK